jgi:hypothetical protein
MAIRFDSQQLIDSTRARLSRGVPQAQERETQLAAIWDELIARLYLV